MGAVLPGGFESIVLVKGRAEESEKTKLPLGRDSSSRNHPSYKRPKVTASFNPYIFQKEWPERFVYLSTYLLESGGVRG